MKEYISTIIYICIFSIILEIILPNTKLKKYIATLICIIVLIVIVSPIIDVIKEDRVTEVISHTLENISDTKGTKTKNPYDFTNYENKVIFENVKQELEQKIYNSLAEKYARIISIKKVKVELTDNFEIDKICIYIKDTYLVSQADKVISYLQSEYNIPQDKIEIINKGE